MKYHDQLNESDCLRTCIACLLDLHPEKVPDFTGIEGWDECVEDAGGFQKWYLLLQGWLGERGYWFLEVRLDENSIWQPLPVETYAILVGNTPAEHPHMIVGKAFGQKFRPVHDPHPSKPGITRVRGVCFLVPVDPITMLRMGEKLEAIEQTAKNLLSVRGRDIRLQGIWQNAREGLQKSVIEIAG